MPVLEPGRWMLAAAALVAVWLAAIFAMRRKTGAGGGWGELQYPLFAAAVLATAAMAQPGSGAAKFLGTYLAFAAAILSLLTTVWLLSLAMRDTSIMDIAYPLTAAVPTALLVWRMGSWSAHEVVLVATTALWSLRLALHIGVRNIGGGEDRRYARWRERHGPNWWWWSYFQVFLLQGALVWFWCLPIAVALHAAPNGLTWLHLVAIGVFIIGFGFQALGDYQLERFRKTRRDRTQVLDTGVWSLSRHPNYFGEAVIWWSFWLAAMAVSPALAAPTILAPLHVTWFMMKGSATPMQERYLAKTKPGYAEYARRVPLFFPFVGGKS